MLRRTGAAKKTGFGVMQGRRAAGSAGLVFET